MFKKFLALICSLSLVMMFPFSAGADADTAYTQIDDLSGNLIKYGRFDHQSDIDGLLAEEDTYWTAGRAYKFELDRNNTYNGSLGSLKVTQRENYFQDRQAKASLRRNHWYNLKGAVKLAKNYSETTNFQIIMVYGANMDQYKFFEQKTVTADNWLVLDEYFQTPVQVDNGSFSYNASDTASLYENVRFVFRITRGNDATAAENLSVFYLDELSLTPVIGNMNPNLENPVNFNTYWYIPSQWNPEVRSSDWWGLRASTSWIDFNASSEGVEDLVNAGEFPNISRYVSVDDVDNQGAMIPFSQNLALESNTVYDVSLWVKSEDPQGKFSTVFSPFDMQHPVLYTQWGTFAVWAKTETTANKWTHIKYQIWLDGNGMAKAFDGWPAVRYQASHDIGESAEQGKKFYIAEYRINETKNIIQNPYFIYGAANVRQMDDEYNGSNACMSNWENNERIIGIIDPETSYDGSKAYAKFTATESAPYVYQNHSVSSAKKYEASAWVKLSENCNIDTASAAFVFGDQKLPVQTVNKNAWTKITLGSYIPSVSGNTDLGIALVNNDGTYITDGEFYFTDFTVKEVEEDAVINSITLNEDFSESTPLTPNISMQTIQPCALSYLYTMTSSDGTSTVVKSGETGVGEAIPPLDYDSSYAGNSISLTARPYSVYNTWGNAVTSEPITVLTGDAVDAEVTLLEICDTEEGFPISDLDGKIDDLSNYTSVQANVMLSNPTGSLAKATVIVAGYNSQGKIVDITMEEAVCQPNSSNVAYLSPSMNVSATTGITKVTVMVWNGSIKPLSPSVTAE